MAWALLEGVFKCQDAPDESLDTRRSGSDSGWRIFRVGVFSVGLWALSLLALEKRKWGSRDSDNKSAARAKT